MVEVDIDSVVPNNKSPINKTNTLLIETARFARIRDVPFNAKLAVPPVSHDQ